MKFFLFLIPFVLFSYDLNLSFLLTKPKSYVRDFYLTEFMRETNNSVLAFKAFSALYKIKLFKHTKLLAKFPQFKKIYECINVKKEYLRKVNISCILNDGLSLKTISKLNKNDLLYLYKNLPPSKQRSAVKDFLDNNFSNVFKNRDLGYYFMIQFPNKRIDQNINDFSIFEDSYFYMFVKNAVVYRLNKIQHSLDKIDYKNFDDNVKWWLFLNSMTLKNYKRAKNILLSIKNKNSKINFWLWKLTGKKKYFDYLLSQTRINFYTLYAYEKAKKNFIIKRNIIYNSVKNPKFNETNPWDVLKFFYELKNSKNLFAFAKKLDCNKTMALKAIVLDKAYHYKYNYFITPDIYNDKNLTLKSFVYAIARQESRFIPASVSRSYALGMMQIMPFLVRMYKENVFKQFNYKENIKLGVKYIKWLFKNLHSPLMVAYAYNGGIGFVKRKVLPFFKYKGKFEPFLSMELIPLDESREYGKKVLANFVVYSHIFGNKSVTLSKIIGK